MERGVYTLLADIIKYLPSPDQRSATGMNVLTQELFEANYNFAKAKTAYVFKTIMDPFIGKYSLFKVMSGVIKSDDNLYDQVKGQEIRISKLYVMKGSKAEEVEELHAGRCGCPQQGAGLADLHDTFDQGNAGSLSGDRNFHAILCNALFCGRCQGG